MFNRRGVNIDILIRGGTVYDGTGMEPFLADVGISGDRIALIEEHTAKGTCHLDGKPAKIIDAKDMAVCPGFIDTHAHSDFTLIADPRAEGKISQGITTEINGNCGLSAAPLYGNAAEQRDADLKDLRISERWSTFKEYFAIIEKLGLSVNCATLAGHGNLRACTAGYENRKLTSAERLRMVTLLEECLNDGAIGISSGLIYPPGVYSDTDELIDLCKALHSYHNRSMIQLHQRNPIGPNQPSESINSGSFGIYASHMRSEGDQLIESINEIIRIGRESGIRVHISHIKTSGENNWHKIDQVISMIQEAREEGIHITCDRYPYTASSTDLDTLLPTWTYEGGAEKEIERLTDNETRKRIRQQILLENPESNYWENISIATVASEKNRWMEGKSIASIAMQKGLEPVDLVLSLLIEEGLRSGAIFSSMCEENLIKFLSLSYSMIGTDSSARSTSGPTFRGKPHPRGFGSFPRFLGTYARDKSLMRLESAVQKATMLPAKTFGIRNRGVLKKGACADIVVFDPGKINDRATFGKPFLKPDGVTYVIVNGVLSLKDGELTVLRGGRILRYGKD